MKIRVLFISCIFIAAAVLCPLGCFSSKINRGKADVVSFVKEHAAELGEVEKEVYRYYSYQLENMEMYVIDIENVKSECTSIIKFLNDYKNNGFDAIRLSENNYLLFYKKGATGNLWTYIGFYCSRNGSYKKFFTDSSVEMADSLVIETVKDSDDSAESENIFDNWFVFVQYY